jgi:hypothetical protein
MAWGRSRSGSSRVAWLALIVALAALALAWSAYRRTGGDLGGLADDFARDAGRRIRGEETARVELGRELEDAWERLRGSRDEVSEGRDLAGVEREVADVRERLEAAYEDAGAGARRRWESLDAELERLQGQLGAGGAGARRGLDAALEELRARLDEAREVVGESAPAAPERDPQGDRQGDPERELERRPE